MEARTQNEPDHSAEVACPTAKVEEGESRVKIQSLHHLRIDTWSRQVDVSMPPCQILKTTIVCIYQLAPPLGDSTEFDHADLICIIPVFIQVIVRSVYSAESPLH